MYKIVLALLLVPLIYGLQSIPVASATIGDELLCESTGSGSYGGVGMDSNDAGGQTFELASPASVGAIKWNILYDPAYPLATTLDIHITETSSNKPDMNNILGSTTVSKTSLPQATGSPYPFSCDPTSNPTQVFEFDPPVALNSLTKYAVVAEYGSGDVTGNVFIMPYVIGSDPYADGFQFDCNVPSQCSLLTPSTWDAHSGSVDSGFAIFDNVQQISTVGTVDGWLDNLLDQIGLNGPMGKALFGSFVGIVVMLVVIMRQGPPMIAMAMGGMFGIGIVGATLLSAQIFLSIVAILGAGLMVAIFNGMRRDTNG